jgi:catechol 2,3-dioxygenase-like lactoylglutathione lyase family enzyme
MSLSPAALDSAYRQAERALRKPSSAVWLCGVTLRTPRFDEALGFYVRTLGLTLGDVGADPVSAQVRAQMLDAEGRPVLRLVDSPDATHGVRELAFGMPRRTVALLRSRLDLQGVRYTDAGSVLYLHDPDGTLLSIEAL